MLLFAGVFAATRRYIVSPNHSHRTVGLRRLVAIALCLAPRAASAHANHSPRGDKWIKIDVRPDRVRVVYTLSFGPLSALLVRRDMDRDSNRQITDAEAAARVGALQSEIERATQLTLDGHRVRIEWAAPFTEGSTGPMRAEPFTLELSGSVEVAGGTESLFVLSDGFAMREIARSTYTASATAPAVLVAAGPRPAPRSLETTAVFAERPREAVRHTFAVRFRTPGAPAPRARMWTWVGVGVVAVAVALAAWRRIQRTTKG